MMMNFRQSVIIADSAELWRPEVAVGSTV